MSDSVHKDNYSIDLRFDSCNRYGTYPIGAVAFGLILADYDNIDIASNLKKTARVRSFHVDNQPVGST